MMTSKLATTLIVALSIATWACAHTPAVSSLDATPRPVKVLIISMFAPEAEAWLAPLGLTEEIRVPGLSAGNAPLRCNASGVCLVVTGMGHANAAASVLAVTLDPRFDLRRTYFLVAGIGTRAPGVRPEFKYETEAFRLDEKLLQKVLALTKDVPLQDSPEAVAYRAHFPSAPANQPPRVIQCDTLAGDTWWHGDLLGAHAREWTRLLTDGGVYCTTQQEDTATYNALARAAAAGKLDLRRVAVLRSGSNFDRPYPGQTAAESLQAAHEGGSGGFGPATRNLYLVGGVVVREIVANWDRWRDGVPSE